MTKSIITQDMLTIVDNTLLTLKSLGVIIIFISFGKRRDGVLNTL